MIARPITKENVSQMRRSALAMIAKSEYLEYRSKQMELCNNIASLVHVFGLNSCVRTVWSMDHSFEDLSLHLGYNKPSDKLKLDPDASHSTSSSTNLSELQTKTHSKIKTSEHNEYKHHY